MARRRSKIKYVESIELSELSELLRWVAGDGRDPATMTIDVDECASLDVVLPLPRDRESGVGVLDVDRLGIPISGQPRSQVIDSIEQPRIASFGREENQLANGDMRSSCPAARR
jgi:hypothetical protein